MKVKRFILIDDDAGNNCISKLLIKSIYPDMEINAFEDAEEGLEFLVRIHATTYDANDINILFLDINMPSWSGWDFLQHYTELDDEIKNSTRICILSSSIDERDMERAGTFEEVKDYIVKPLSAVMLPEIVGKVSGETVAWRGPGDDFGFASGSVQQFIFHSASTLECANAGSF